MKKILILIIAVFYFGNLYSQTAEEFFEKGNKKYEIEDYINAILDFNQAIELKSDYSDAYYFRGCSKSFIDDYQNAILDISKAIELKT